MSNCRRSAWSATTAACARPEDRRSGQPVGVGALGELAGQVAGALGPPAVLGGLGLAVGGVLLLALALEAPDLLFAQPLGFHFAAHASGFSGISHPA